MILGISEMPVYLLFFFTSSRFHKEKRSCSMLAYPNPIHRIVGLIKIAIFS